MLVIAAPGQGAQTPGFLSPGWSSPASPTARRLVRAGRCRPDQVRDRPPTPTRSGTPRSPSRCWSRPPSPRPRRCSAGSTRPRCTPARSRRAQRGRAGRRRHRRGALRRGRDAPGPGAGPGHGPGRRHRGDRDDRGARRRRGRGARRHRGARAHPGEHQRRRARSSPPGRWSSWPRSPPTRPPRRRLRPLSGGRAPSTPGTWPRRWTRCARPRPTVHGQRPGAAAAVQPGRRRRADRRGLAGADRRPRSARRSGGTCACATMTDLGRGRADRAAAGRHADRAGPAGDARRGAGRPEDPRRPRRAPPR